MPGVKARRWECDRTGSRTHVLWVHDWGVYHSSEKVSCDEWYWNPSPDISGYMCAATAHNTSRFLRQRCVFSGEAENTHRGVNPKNGCISMQRYWSSLRYSFLRTLFLLAADLRRHGILGIPLPALLSNTGLPSPKHASGSHVHRYR